MRRALSLAVWIGAWATLAPASLPAADAPAPDWISAAAGFEAQGFTRPTGPFALDLPADHAPHPDARTEAWQIAAHLTGPDGAPVGVQILFFRLGLIGPAAEGPATDWTPRDLWRGHVIVLDGTDGPALGRERLARGFAGLAGHDAGTLRLDDWSLSFDADSWRIAASAGDTRIALDLIPARAPLSLDAAEAPFRGYILSRLDVTGRLETAAGTQAVTGSAWYDHLWGELPLPGAAAVVSDRLLVQLDDGSDLSVIRSRRADGRGLDDIDAVLIGADGTARPLDGAAELTVAGRWQGAAANWPVAWDLRLGDLQLAIRPVAEAQEQPFLAPVWSGLVTAEGSRAGAPLRGLGTLQLSGEGLE